MHTSQEARSEGRRFYTPVNERPPREGKDTFTRINGTSVTVLPSESFRNPQSDYSNKIWVNFAVDRLVFSNMKTQHRLLISLSDYNIHEDNLRKMKVLVITADRQFIPPQPTKSGQLRSMPNLQEYIIAVKNWNKFKGIPEESFQAHLEYQQANEDVNKRQESIKKQGGFSYRFKIKWLTQLSTDLPPCSTDVNRYGHWDEIRQ